MKTQFIQSNISENRHSKNRKREEEIQLWYNEKINV